MNGSVESREMSENIQPFIHPTAIVEDGATLGSGVGVWHYAHVRAGATIGANSQIGKSAYVDVGVRIGARCKVQNFVSVYGGVTLGDDVFIGPSVTFTNDLHPRSFGEWILIPTYVHDGASIGANSTIVCGNDIGPYSMVGAGSVVVRPVGERELVVGNPAKLLGYVCLCGLRSESNIGACDHGQKLHL